MRSQVLYIVFLLIASLCSASQWYFLHVANAPTLQVQVNAETPFTVGQYYVSVQDVPSGNIMISVLHHDTVLLSTNITVAVNETGSVIIYGSTEANTTVPLTIKAIPSPSSIGDNTTNFVGFFDALIGVNSIDIGVEIVGSNIQYTPVHYGEFTGFDTIQVPSGEVVLEIIVNGTTYTHEPGIIKMGSIYLLVVGGQTGPSGTTTVPMPLLVYDQPTYGKFRFGHFLPNAADLDVIIDDQVVGRVNFGNLSDEIQLRLGVFNVTFSGATTFMGLAPQPSSIVSDGHYRITVSNTTANPVLNTFVVNHTVPAFLTGTYVTVINLVSGYAMPTNVQLMDSATGVYTVSFNSMQYGATASQDIPSNTYDVYARNNNTIVASTEGQNFVQYADVTVFVGNGVVTVWVDHTYSIPSSIAYIRFVNAAPKLDKKVDLLVDDGVLVKSVGFSHFSNYVNYTWPANETTVTRSFSVRESNNTLAVLITDISNDRNYTIAFVGLQPQPNPNVSSPYDYAVVSFSDALLVGSDSALLRYVNLVPANDTFSVTLEDLPLPNDWNQLPYLKATRYIAFSAVSVEVSLNSRTNASLDAEKFDFKNATSYTAWAMGSAGDEQLVITQDYPPPSKSSGLTSLELGLIIGGAILFAILLLAIVVFVVRSNRSEGYEQIGSPSYDR